VGGSGSGRWNHHEKRRTVEESWTLDVAGLPLNGPLSYPLSGTLKAIRITGSRRVLPVHYTLVEEDGRPILTLTYTPDGSSSAGASEERLGFITTKANFGGVRWWFACPLGVEGERCNRPVAKLYLPPQGRRKFGCRGVTTSPTKAPKRVTHTTVSPPALRAARDRERNTRRSGLTFLSPRKYGENEEG
jgi:hypothetical protein